jgi:hypothetical protein
MTHPTHSFQIVATSSLDDKMFSLRRNKASEIERAQNQLAPTCFKILTEFSVTEEALRRRD